MIKPNVLLIAGGLIFFIGTVAAVPKTPNIQINNNFPANFTTYPVTDSNNVNIGINLGADSTASYVLYNDGTNNNILAFANGIYLITDKTVYFNGSDCSGNAYVESYSQTQSNIARSVIFYPLASIGGNGRMLYSVNSTTVTPLSEQSKFSNSVGTCQNETNSLSQNFLQLNALPADLVALHPNPKVVYP